jgi:hypothetical protein
MTNKKKFMIAKPELQKRFQGTLQTEKEDKHNDENMEKNKSH